MRSVYGKAPGNSAQVAIWVTRVNRAGGPRTWKHGSPNGTDLSANPSKSTEMVGDMASPGIRSTVSVMGARMAGARNTESAVDVWAR